MDDLGVAVADHLKNVLAGNAVLNVRGAEIEKVGDLVVILEALARRGDDDHAAGGICVYNGFDLGKLMCVGERGAAEF